MIFIMRGLPGSGKDTWLTKHHPGVMLFSADQFMVDEKGEFRFDPAKLQSCHDACLRGYIEAVRGGIPDIAVSNSNIIVHEMAPYVAVAQAYRRGYEIVRISATVADCATRNIHGVPEATIQKMAEKAEPLPPRWKPELVITS